MTLKNYQKPVPTIRLRAFAIPYVLVLLFICSMAQAADKAKEYVLAPVYFVTDRVPIKENGKIQRFIDYGQSISNYSAGVRFVPIVVRPDIKSQWSDLEAIGWLDEPHFPVVKTASKDSLQQRAIKAAAQLNNFDLSDDELIAKIKKLPTFESGASNPKAELLVFVHGFFNTFEESTDSAGELSSWFKRPVWVYCWTTPKVQVKPNGIPIPLTGLKVPNLTPKIWQSYRESEVTHQHGQDKFTSLLQALSLSFDPKQIVLVAHSMGSRLLDQALLCRSGYFDKVADTQKFKEIILSNPDLDGKYFASHADELSDQANLVRVFFVRQDGAMEVARFLHGAHNRLGAPDKSIFAEIRKSKVNMIDMSDLDKSTLGLIGHTMPAWVLSNLHNYGTIDNTKTKYLEERPNGDDSMIVIKRQPNSRPSYKEAK